MNRKTLVALMGMSLFGAACMPDTPVQRANISEAIEYYAYELSGDSRVLRSNRLAVTAMGIFDQSITQQPSLRYVLPEYSKDAFYVSHPKFGGSIYRPIELQKTTLTYGYLESSDDLTSTVTFKTIDLAGKLIPEWTAYQPFEYLQKKVPYTPATDAEAAWLKSKAVFPAGSECYQITEQSVNTDHIEYSMANQLESFEVDEYGNAKGYKLQKFGLYEYYLEDGVNLEHDQPTPLILKVGSRFYTGLFHPKNTIFFEKHDILDAEKALAKAKNQEDKVMAEIELAHATNKCHFFNQTAAKAINLTLKK